MSDAETPVEASLVESAPGVAGRSERPGGLIAVCVIAMVLGGMGVLLGLWTMVSSLFVEQLQSSFMFSPAQTTPGASAEMAEIMQQMQTKMNGIAVQYRWPNFGLSFVHVFVATLLLAGAIGALRLKPAGRTLLAAGCGTAILFEFLRGILQTHMQMQISSVMTNYMTAIMEASTPAGAPGPPPEFFASMMKVGVFLGIAFTLAFALAKIIFYVVSIKYLNNPGVKALFYPPTRAS